MGELTAINIACRTELLTVVAVSSPIGGCRRNGGRTLSDRSFDTEVQPSHSTDAGEQAPASRGYRVRIEYTEPEFHRRNPHCPEAYTALFDCTDAGSRREAIDMALMEFDHYARVSRVRWRRIVRAITVQVRSRINSSSPR